MLQDSSAHGAITRFDWRGDCVMQIDGHGRFDLDVAGARVCLGDAHSTCAEGNVRGIIITIDADHEEFVCVSARRDGSTSTPMLWLRARFDG